MDPDLSRRKFLQIGTAATVVLTGCGETSEPGDGGVEAGRDAGRDVYRPDIFETGDAATEPDSAIPQDGGVDAGDPTALAFDAIPEVADVFPLGIMAGDVTSDRVVLWTQYSASTALTLRVLEMDGTRIVGLAHEGEVTVGTGGYVHADINGLTPGARHEYAFLIRSGTRYTARSPIGRFRAAIAADALEPVTFGGTSCTSQDHAPFPTMRHAGSRRDLDFFIHGGDHAYCDGARTLSDYRTKYAQNWNTTGFRALHSSTALYMSLDDHEIDNNFNPETHDRTVLANGVQTFFEHRALRRNATSRNRVWRSYKWGRTLEVWVLDCRMERKPSTRESSAPEYISRAQMDWLKQGLTRSTAMFKFIVNSVPITNFPSVFDVQSSDRWEGYAAQRREILDHIVQGSVDNVWWLSGDFHLGCIGKLEGTGAYAGMREVLMGQGGNSANPVVRFSPGVLRNEQFDWFTGENNYTVFRVDPQARTLEVEFVDAAGDRLFSRRYTAT